MPGWTAQLDRDAAAGTVRSVTWTAAPGTGIAADQFALFRISVQLPDTPTVSLPATQTYSDGTIVKWDQPPPPGGGEPEHPAPVIAHWCQGRCRRPAIRCRWRKRRSRKPRQPAADNTARWLAAQRSGGRRHCGGDRPTGATASMNHVIATLVWPCSLAVAAVAGAGVASAHAVRVATDPVENTALNQGPPKVSATFNEALQPQFAAMTVVGPDGNLWSTGDPRGGRRRRQRRRATAGPVRHLHGELPGDVGGRPRGLRVVVVHADGVRHGHPRAVGRAATTQE